jgi:hypothetical protein
MSYLLIDLGIVLGIVATDIYLSACSLSYLGSSITPFGNFTWILIGHPTNPTAIKAWSLILSIFAVIFFIAGMASKGIKMSNSPVIGESSQLSEIRQISMETDSPRRYFMDLTKFLKSLNFEVISNNLSINKDPFEDAGNIDLKIVYKKKYSLPMYESNRVVGGFFLIIALMIFFYIFINPCYLIIFLLLLVPGVYFWRKPGKKLKPIIEP